MRSCGECIACCTYLRINELDKPGMEHCEHSEIPDLLHIGTRYYTGSNGDKNCKIYTDPNKPACCDGYLCLWKQGHGYESDRPDKSLMLFDRTKKVENAIEAKPLIDGMESTPEGRALITRMAQSYGSPAVVLNFCERRVVRIEGRV